MTSIALAAAIAATLALTGCSSNEPPQPSPSSGPDASQSEANAFDIEVGDCLNDAEASGTVTTAPIVPCDEPHDSEAYAIVTVPDGDYPGEDAIKAQADAGCVAEFAEFVGVGYTDSELEYTFYFPSENSWAQGDREILCEVYDPDSQTTGSLAGSAR